MANGQAYSLSRKHLSHEKESYSTKFKNENKERDFWAKINLAEYLKPTSDAISIRISDHLLTRLKERANEMNVPYQPLIKEYIAEGVARDRAGSA